MKITDEILKDKIKDFYLLWDKNDFRGLYKNRGTIDFFWALHTMDLGYIKNEPSIKEIEEDLERDNFRELSIWAENSYYNDLEYSIYINFDQEIGVFSERKLSTGNSLEKEFLLTSLLKDPIRTYKKMIEYFESLSTK
jgi:hypothetical protein